MLACAKIGPDRHLTHLQPHTHKIDKNKRRARTHNEQQSKITIATIGLKENQIDPNQNAFPSLNLMYFIYLFVCVCVCVKLRETEAERKTKKKASSAERTS